MPARVMIVEDDFEVALLLRYNLEASGYSVEHVERGDEAEARIAECAPDLLLVDWKLPGISGIELCRRIRRYMPQHRLPIMMVTARIDPADRDYAAEMGANDYVTKPFAVSDILRRARNLLPPA